MDRIGMSRRRRRAATTRTAAEPSTPVGMTNTVLDAIGGP
jgi:hypothetical protein